MKYRIGYGYDVHAFAEGCSLILGGVEIPHHKGLKGHSDADVLLHAISDALLGAANLRDIGYHFPDTDPQYKNADSTVLLAHSMTLLRERGYDIGNIDATVCAEQPKINPHIPSMQKRIASILLIEVDDISIKATTSERMGFVGREEGISVHAVALITKP